MKICVVQTQARKGNIPANILQHKKITELAVDNGVDLIIFPELSITGYEPSLAKELATDQNDGRFDDFQTISDASQVIIGVGMPIKSKADPVIGMILFQPGKPRQTYFKRYIHADEEPFFKGGVVSNNIIGDQSNIALAICYELSVPKHSEDAFKNGAQFYIASVAKTAKGVDKAIYTLADIAKTYGMTVLLSNCVGLADGEECGGKSSAWNNQGELLAQLNDTDEGLLILDTDTGAVIKQII